MYKFKVAELASLLCQLTLASRMAANFDSKNPGQRSPDAAVEALLKNLEQLQSFQHELQLDNALINQLYMHVEQIKNGSADLRANALRILIEDINGGLVANLSTRFFLFVPSQKARYYNNVTAFGDSAFVFREAFEDMYDAGTCYAADMPTACVFHLTRVAEFGLRALARKLRVSLRDHGKPCQVEYATWNKVLDSIDGKIRTIREKAAGQKKNEQLRFYADAANHCRHIRDLYRNEVSHTRTRFNEHEAFAAMNRIADFMQLLAEGLYSDAERKKIIVSNWAGYGSVLGNLNDGKTELRSGDAEDTQGLQSGDAAQDGSGTSS